MKQNYFLKLISALLVVSFSFTSSIAYSDIPYLTSALKYNSTLRPESADMVPAFRSELRKELDLPEEKILEQHSLADITVQFVKTLFNPRSELRSNIGPVSESEVRSLIFQHINGLMTIPILHYLSKAGVFYQFGSWTQPESLSLASLESRFASYGEKFNAGNIYGAMRTLALQGWVRMWGIDQQTVFSLTEKGQIAALLANAGYLETPVKGIADVVRLHEYFHQPSQDGRYVELKQYKALVEQSARGWSLPSSSSPIFRHHDSRVVGRVIEEVRTQIDGIIMSATMVALGMPVYRDVDGEIVQVGESIFNQLEAQNNSFDIGLISESFQRGFIDAAFDLLAIHSLAERQPHQRHLVRLTPKGLSFMKKVGSYGVTTSYLKSYKVLDQMLFGNPDPLGIDRDGHIDRVMDIWGSSFAHKAYIQDIIARVDRIFNAPIEAQPAGIADMGAGDGHLLKLTVDHIIQNTLRGKHLKEHPLVVIAADYNEKSRLREANTLKAFENTEGIVTDVLFGDVTNPEEYDEAIKKSMADRRMVIYDRELRMNRPVGARDLLHMQMVLPHERKLKIKSIDEAREILKEAVLKTDRALLQSILNIQPLPENLDDLSELIATRFRTSYSDKGKLVPAVVAAADLIKFFQRWEKYINHGLILLELHTADPDVFLSSDDPVTAVNKAAQVPASAYWGTHWISQTIMPYTEYRLIAALSGVRTRDAKPFPKPESGLPAMMSLTTFLQREARSELRTGDKSKNPLLDGQILPWWIAVPTLLTAGAMITVAVSVIFTVNVMKELETLSIVSSLKPKPRNKEADSSRSELRARVHAGDFANLTPDNDDAASRSAITYLSDGPTLTWLNETESEKIYNHLREKGFLKPSGYVTSKVTDQTQPTDLNLPKKYSLFEAKVLDYLRKVHRIDKKQRVWYRQYPRWISKHKLLSFLIAMVVVLPISSAAYFWYMDPVRAAERALKEAKGTDLPIVINDQLGGKFGNNAYLQDRIKEALSFSSIKSLPDINDKIIRIDIQAGTDGRDFAYLIVRNDASMDVMRLRDTVLSERPEFLFANGENLQQLILGDAYEDFLFQKKVIGLFYALGTSMFFVMIPVGIAVWVGSRGRREDSQKLARLAAQTLTSRSELRNAEVDTLISKVRAGDDHAAGELISFIENGGEVAELIHQKLDAIHIEQKPRRIGVTGAVGVGKSTLVEDMIVQYRRQGKRIAAIAIDPTSPVTGGAILADRMRLSRELLTDENVFYRSMATRGGVGGIAKTTEQVAKVFDIYGVDSGTPKDFVFIETEGVGQSQKEIRKITDTMVAAIPPESGDILTLSKDSYLTVADVLVVNKADRKGARETAEIAKRVFQKPQAKDEWMPPVIETVAIEGEGKGISELIDAVSRHGEFLKVHSKPAAGPASEFKLAKGRALVVELGDKNRSLAAAEFFRSKGFEVIYVRETSENPEAARHIARAAIDEDADIVYLDPQSEEDMQLKGLLAHEVSSLKDRAVVVYGGQSDGDVIYQVFENKPAGRILDEKNLADYLEKFSAKRRVIAASGKSGITMPLIWWETRQLLNLVKQGDHRAAARLMTFMESTGEEIRPVVVSEIQKLPRNSYRIGITGPPGVGKSSFIANLAGEIRRTGLRVGIVSVDPSSDSSGGAFLVDRYRMGNLADDTGVMIRSVSLRDGQGGIAKTTDEVAKLMDHMGVDVVLIETEGAGQTQDEIRKVSDTLLLTLSPAYLGEIQTMKAGSMETPDIAVLNQADTERAFVAIHDLEAGLSTQPAREDGWQPLAVQTVSTGEKQKGFSELLLRISAHLAHLNQKTKPTTKRKLAEKELITVQQSVPYLVQILRETHHQKVIAGEISKIAEPMIQKARESWLQDDRLKSIAKERVSIMIPVSSAASFGLPIYEDKDAKLKIAVLELPENLGVIEFIEPEDPDHEMSKFLRERGESIYSIGLLDPNEAQPVPRIFDFGDVPAVQVPGQYPFRRGAFATYKSVTPRQYAGYSTARETNERFRLFLERGFKAFSLAFQNATQVGIDSDDPRAIYNIGTEGAPVDSIRDMETIFDGIDITDGEVSTSMTINASAGPILAMYIALGTKRLMQKDSSLSEAEAIELAKKTLRGTVQNDNNKERTTRNNYGISAKGSMRLANDMFEYFAGSRFNTISISGYHMREAGSSAVQEVAFTLMNAILYAQNFFKNQRPGSQVTVNQVLEQFSFFFDSLLMDETGETKTYETAKFRAARELWAIIARHILKARDENKNKALMFRVHTQTSGVPLKGDPEGVDEPANIARILAEGLVAVDGGTQTLHLDSYDENRRLPSEHAAKVALRSHEILKQIADKQVDPNGGSYLLEKYTDEIINQAAALIQFLIQLNETEGQEAVEQYMRDAIQDEVTKKGMLREERLTKQGLKGKGQGVREEKAEKVDITEEMLRERMGSYEERRAEVLGNLEKLKQTRDNEKVRKALAEITKAAEENENVMPYFIKAALAEATVGEMMDAVRGVFGDFKKSVFPSKTSRQAPIRKIESKVPVRILMAKPGLDGHDRGINLVSAAFKNAGLEVIYAGLRQTPAMIARAAVDENADIIGISSLSGARLHFVRDLMNELDQYGAKDRIKVIVGGITEDEGPYLKYLGVDQIFDPSHHTGELHQALEYIQILADSKDGRQGLIQSVKSELRNLFNPPWQGDGKEPSQAAREFFRSTETDMYQLSLDKTERIAGLKRQEGMPGIQKIVHLGAGTGNGTARLLKLAGINAQVIAADISKSFLRHLIKLLPKDLYPNLRVYLLEKLTEGNGHQNIFEALGPASRGLIDLVYAPNLIHTVAVNQIAHVFEGIAKTLHPDGKLVLSTPGILRNDREIGVEGFENLLIQVRARALEILSSDGQYSNHRNLTTNGHAGQFQKVFPAHRPLEFYTKALESAGLSVETLKFDPVQTTRQDLIQFFTAAPLAEAILPEVIGSEAEIQTIRKEIITRAFKGVLKGHEKDHFLMDWLFLKAKPGKTGSRSELRAAKSVKSLEIRTMVIAFVDRLAERVIKAAKAMGIKTVILYTDLDAQKKVLSLADEKIQITRIQNKAFNIRGILDAAKQAKADVIHPGFGVLSETPELISAAKEANIRVIGPDHQTVSAVRIHPLKSEGKNPETIKERIQRYGIKVPPSSEFTVDGPLEAIRAAGELGYPVLVKSAVGGVDRLLGLVQNQDEMRRIFNELARNAVYHFRHDGLFIEKLVPEVRHIEVQFAADQFGNVSIWPFQDGTIQRRYQKLIEETPPALMSQDKDEEIRSAVRTILAGLRKDGLMYQTVGTMEFLMTQSGEIYFLDINRNIDNREFVNQDGKPVDLIQLQIAIAGGQSLPDIKLQPDIKSQDHTIKLSVFAEDFAHDFSKYPEAVIEKIALPPAGNGVDIQLHIKEGDKIHISRSSSLATLTIRAKTRTEAIERLKEALDQFEIKGQLNGTPIKTTLLLYKQLAVMPSFINGEFDTNYLAKLESAILKSKHDPKFPKSRDAFDDPDSIYEEALHANHGVCPLCHKHHYLPARKRLAMLLDKDQPFEEMNAGLEPVDFLNFKGKKTYAEDIAENQERMKEKDAIVTGVGYINGRKVAIAVLEYYFIAGTFGSVMGEKIARLVERANEEGLPLVIVSQSGGARILEGNTSMMQLGKVSVAIAKYKREGGLYISLMADPTLAGPAVSFSNQGDLLFAEPEARIGFAGERVTREFLRITEKTAHLLGADFQNSKIWFEGLLIDGILHRKDQKARLSVLIERFYQTGRDQELRGKYRAVPAVALPKIPNDFTPKQNGRAAIEVVKLARINGKDQFRPRVMEYMNALGRFTVWPNQKDPAVVGGVVRMDHGKEVVVIGTQKGQAGKVERKKYPENETGSYLYQWEQGRLHSAMPLHGGYQFSRQLLKHAEANGLPVITFLDLPGGFSGPEGENNGIAKEVALNLLTFANLTVPVIIVITGEGGSGGAMALALGNRVLIQENAYYSVIAPESASKIIFRDYDPEHVALLADSLALTPERLKELKIVDEIVEEPAGGAHLDHNAAVQKMVERIRVNLEALSKLSPDEIRNQRYWRFRNLGYYRENGEIFESTIEPSRAKRSELRKFEDTLTEQLLTSGLQKGLIQLQGLIRAKLSEKPGDPVVVRIAGLSGSGQSTFSQIITKQGTAGVLPEDIQYIESDDYLPPTVPEDQRIVDEDGFLFVPDADKTWIDYVYVNRFKKDLKQALSGKKIVLVAGVFGDLLLSRAKPELSVVPDIQVLVETDDKVRRDRIIRRESSDLTHQTSQMLFNEFVAGLNPDAGRDLIIQNNQEVEAFKPKPSKPAERSELRSDFFESLETRPEALENDSDEFVTIADQVSPDELTKNEEAVSASWKVFTGNDSAVSSAPKSTAAQGIIIPPSLFFDEGLSAFAVPFLKAFGDQVTFSVITRDEKDKDLLYRLNQLLPASGKIMIVGSAKDAARRFTLRKIFDVGYLTLEGSSREIEVVREDVSPFLKQIRIVILTQQALEDLKVKFSTVALADKMSRTKQLYNSMTRAA